MFTSFSHQMMGPSSWSDLTCTVWPLGCLIYFISVKTLAIGVLLSLLELNLHKVHLPFTVCNTTLVNFLILAETPFFLIFSDDWSNLVMTMQLFSLKRYGRAIQDNGEYVNDHIVLKYIVYQVSCILPPTSDIWSCPRQLFFLKKYSGSIQDMG